MSGYYFKFAVRNLLKNRRFTLINIFGLATGMVSVLLILVYVLGELSYENFHIQRNRIYRVAVDFGLTGSKMGLPGPMPALGPAAAAQIPEVENAVRWRGGFQSKLANGEKSFAERNLYFVDETVFDIFSFELLKGNRNALNEPFTAVVSQSAARKYFDRADPVGQTLLYNGEHYLTITGVMEDVPANTHLKCDFLVSYASLTAMGKVDEGVWNSAGNDFTYILLRENADPESVLEKLHVLLAANVDENSARMMTFVLQPLTGIHFNTHCFVDWGRNGNLTYVYVFGTVALLILLIAGFNFINLSTARFQYRRHEVSIKKVLGAGRLQMIRQFLLESILISLGAIVVALALFEILFPQLADFLGSSVLLIQPSLMKTLLLVIALGAVNGILAGLYPSLSLSGFKPIAACLGRRDGGFQKSTLREFLFLVLLANIIAWPVAYLLMQRWLSGYTYRIEMDFVIFLGAALVTLIIAILTIGHRAVRVALANPVDALHHE